ncbi:MAG TPA: septum formation family protein, partial [Micromonosporaceae bacterium]|nr:septum formation family protein [Micromonosporaceae bacterium]
MRRWLTATVLGVAAALVLSGCQAPAGVDGKLVDDWSALGEPKVPVPTAGTCYTGSAEEVLDVTGADLKDAGSCTVEHIAEVAHVGQVTGADASRSSVPAEDSAAGKAAYTDCTTTVREFLGDEWMAGRLYLIVHFPSERQWDGGARHYRCSLVEISSEGGNVVKRNSSLRDGLRGGRPLGVGCVNDFGKDAKSVDRIDFVDCDAKHTAEF